VSTGSEDIRDATGQVKPEVEAWLSEIEQAQRDMDPYHKRCKGIRDRYRYEDAKKTNKRKFQMLWSNVEILKPSVYARRPNPEVNSRFKTSDPVVRIASEMLERNLDFQFDLCDYDQAFKEVRNSNLLYGRGAARLVYDAQIEDRDNGDPGPKSLDRDDSGSGPKDDGGLGGEGSGGADTSRSVRGMGGDDNSGADDGEGVGRSGDDIARDAPDAASDEVLRAENVRLEYINRDDLIHPKARRWAELPWLCFRSFLDRAALIKRFGKKVGKKIELDATGTDTEGSKSDTSIGPTKDKATIFEIWDKNADRVLWIAKSYPDVLEEDKPYVTVQGFYPCPRPVFGTLTDDSLVPVPDFIMYQDQAGEIDDLTARIGALTDALKLVGFYPAGPSGTGAPEIEMAMRPGFENRMIAVKSWDAFREGAKGGPPIVWLPVDMVGEIIKGCVELRKHLIDDVYQITGISDILRGDTEAEETAAAQGLKAEWGSVRLRDRQQELARFARDVTRMAGEIISKQFSIDTLMRVASMPLPSDADVQKANAQYQQAMAQYQQIQQLQARSAPVPGGAPGGGSNAPTASPAGSPPGQSAGVGFGGQSGPPPQAAGGPGAPPPSAPPPQPPQKPDLGPTQEQVLATIRDGVTERFAMDIEVDSTIAADEDKEKKSRVEFMEVLNKTMVSAGPIIQQYPAAAPMIAQVILFTIRAFRVGREVEDIIEKTFGDIAASAGGQKPPSPEEIKAQADQARAQAEIMKAKIDQQTAQQKAQSDMQATRLKTQAAVEEHRMDMQKMQMEAQLEAAKMQAHVQIEGHKAQMQTEQMRQQAEIANQQHQMGLAQMQGQAQLDASKMQAQHSMDEAKSKNQQKTLAQMQGQAQLDASKMQAQHSMDEAKSKNQQKTLEQTMAMAEQKAVAQESLEALGLRGGLLKGEQALETAKTNAAAAKARPKER
jgi:hypothetical protein